MVGADDTDIRLRVEVLVHLVRDLRGDTRRRAA
jgi:hypothetical protein